MGGLADHPGYGGVFPVAGELPGGGAGNGLFPLDRPLAESFAVVLCKGACCVRLSASGSLETSGASLPRSGASTRSTHHCALQFRALIGYRPWRYPISRTPISTTPPLTLTHVAVARLSFVSACVGLLRVVGVEVYCLVGPGAVAEVHGISLAFVGVSYRWWR